MQKRNYRPERTLKIDGLKPGDRVELITGKFGRFVRTSGPHHAWIRTLGNGFKAGELIRLHYQQFWLAPQQRTIRKLCQMFRDKDPRPPFSKVDDERPWQPPIYLGLDFDEIAETATCEAEVAGPLSCSSSLEAV